MCLQVETGVLEDIDKTVREQVARLLPQHIPQKLQEELRRHQEELAELEKALHNSYAPFSPP